jgi:hypothetical protein
MSTPSEPEVCDEQPLVFYTGVPNIPREKPDRLTPEEREKGGKGARKTISGVYERKVGTRKNRRSCWKAYVMKSTKQGREHPPFSYECPTREEAAYIVSMAHQLLKPWFAKMCRDGDHDLKPAGPGHRRFFLNNIWGLWKFCRMSTPNGEYILGGLAGGGARKVFVTDFNEVNYRQLIQAPIFNRRILDRKRNLEPVQPWVAIREDKTIRVQWTGLSEIVLGEKVDLPPEILSGIDFRKATLLGENPPPLFPEGWRPLVRPEQFDAITPLIPDWAGYHPYGVISLGFR